MVTAILSVTVWQTEPCISDAVMAAAHSRAPSAHADQPGCSRRRLFPSTVNSPGKRDRAGLLRGSSMIFIELKFIELTLFNVSSTNYYVQYQRFRRTDVTISSKSISFFVSPLLNSPLRRGELTSDFVLHRGNSMKFIPFISSNSRYLLHFLENFIHPFWIHLVHPPDYSSESVTLTPPSPNADFSTACVTLSIFPRRVKFHELVS